MFATNSRYAQISTSSPVNGHGERLLGVDLRLITPSAGTFLHTVLSRDRLDLLALKYYGDPTKWWQISDANSSLPFPTDLLDRDPIREELLSLVAPQLEARFNTLVNDLVALGEAVEFPRMGHSESSLVVLAMTPAIRAQTIAAMRPAGLHFLKSFGWADGVTTGEIFYFEDMEAKQSWGKLLEDIKTLPGILEAISAAEDGVLHVIYNNEQVARGRILALAEVHGYEVVPQSSQEIVQTGTQIIVPPNTVS